MIKSCFNSLFAARGDEIPVHLRCHGHAYLKSPLLKGMQSPILVRNHCCLMSWNRAGSKDCLVLANGLIKVTTQLERWWVNWCCHHKVLTDGIFKGAQASRLMPTGHSNYCDWVFMSVETVTNLCVISVVSSDLSLGRTSLSRSQPQQLAQPQPTQPQPQPPQQQAAQLEGNSTSALLVAARDWTKDLVHVAKMVELKCIFIIYVSLIVAGIILDCHPTASAYHRTN